MKKRLVLWLALLMLFSVTGCANETADVKTPDVEQQPENGEEAEEETKVLIYYGNADADGFEQKEVMIKGLTPENLIGELRKLSVVSIDTEVKAFEQDGKNLKLDLSKGFSGYLNMMGTSGEYIVMGGLVNTFLTAYDGENILITVEGETLETGHTSYEALLVFFGSEKEQETETPETESAEPLKYRLTDASDTENGRNVYYPQFVDMSDGNIQDQWNTAIREIATGLKPETGEDVEYDTYTVDYEIVACSTEFVSFVFRRDMGDHGKDVFAINFDMVNRKCVRLSDWEDALDEAAHNLATGGYYKIISKDTDREAFDEYMKITAPTADEYKEEFLQYDFDLTDLEKAPYGFSYIKDNTLVLVMYISGDAAEGEPVIRSTVEIDTGIKVR